MVGFSPRDERRLKLGLNDFVIAGSVSGSVSRVVVQPLDVIKIRFQLQVEPLGAFLLPKYSSITQALLAIVHEEGWRSLWKGHVPAQMLSVTYGIAQMLTKATWVLLPDHMTTNEWRPVTHTVCGGLAGLIATFTVHPIDVLRTRFVAQGEPKIYTSLGNACCQVIANDGLKGFYHGLSPSLVQIGPQMGLQFGFYSLFTGLWNKTKGTWFDSLPDSTQSLLCGSGSGIISKTIVYPLDVIKKRFEVHRFKIARLQFGVTRSYTGLASCLWQIVDEEGVRGLYKGYVAGVIKAGLVAGVNFLVYEEVCELLSSSRR